MLVIYLSCSRSFVLSWILYLMVELSVYRDLTIVLPCDEYGYQWLTKKTVLLAEFYFLETAYLSIYVHSLVVRLKLRHVTSDSTWEVSAFIDSNSSWIQLGSMIHLLLC